MALSIDVVPVPTDEAVREVERRLLGVETNITNWTRRQNANMNYNVAVPYDMEQQRKESREFLTTSCRDQRMMFATVTLVHFADTPEELDADTEALLSCARKHLCRLSVLRFQQLDGLSTALPIGVRRIEAMRTLTTESLAVLMPFRVQEIMEEGGMYFGENAISRNLILCDKSRLLNPNAFVLGVPGSGKSFSTKELIAMLALSTDDDIVICDPEREYASLAEALGGEVVRIAAGSPPHINAMDMVEGYGEEATPWPTRASSCCHCSSSSTAGDWCRRQVGRDCCTSAVYADYLRGGERPRSPTCATNCSPSPSRRRVTWRFRWSCSPRARWTRSRTQPTWTPATGSSSTTSWIEPPAQDHGAARHHRRDAQPRDGQLARGQAHAHLHRRVPRGVRERVLRRVLQQRVAPLPQAQRLPHGHHAERGVPARFGLGLHDALQLRAHRHAQPGGRRPRETGRTPQHQPRADGLHHQRRGGLRPPALRRRHRAVRQPLPEGHRALPPHDH
ncbi:MAG: VirB4 family type IV secretion system protein [Eggerthella lenta]